MPEDFAGTYVERSDEELLQLASERTSLTPEAAVALDAELTRRNLTRSDQAKHENFVRRSKQLESKKRIRKILGKKEDASSRLAEWGLAAVAVLIIIVVFAAYAALPDQYHFRKDWEQAAEHVTWATVIIAVISTFWWRNAAFWISLLISTSTHVFLLHAWILRNGALKGRGPGKLAIACGFFLFLVTFGLLSFVRLKFSSQSVPEERDNTNPAPKFD